MTRLLRGNENVECVRFLWMLLFVFCGFALLLSSFSVFVFLSQVTFPWSFLIGC